MLYFQSKSKETIQEKCHTDFVVAIYSYAVERYNDLHNSASKLRMNISNGYVNAKYNQMPSNSNEQLKIANFNPFMLRDCC